MADRLRFHVLLLPNVAWTELRERVLRLEQLGVEVAALPDHLVDWTRPDSPWFESWTSLAALADATTAIRLATSVTQITLRNPAMLARQVLTLDQISNGRIELGLGTGLVHDPSYAMAGLPDWDAKERVDRFEEYAQIVLAMLTDEVTSFEGRFYRVDAARSRESGGTGRGLAIVKHIVERHRGSLDIQSTLGMGTSVTVSLPVGS